MYKPVMNCKNYGWWGAWRAIRPGLLAIHKSLKSLQRGSACRCDSNKRALEERLGGTAAADLLLKTSRRCFFATACSLKEASLCATAASKQPLRQNHSASKRGLCLLKTQGEKHWQCTLCHGGKGGGGAARQPRLCYWVQSILLAFLQAAQASCFFRKRHWGRPMLPLGRCTAAMMANQDTRKPALLSLLLCHTTTTKAAAAAAKKTVWSSSWPPCQVLCALPKARLLDVYVSI